MRSSNLAVEVSFELFQTDSSGMNSTNISSTVSLTALSSARRLDEILEMKMAELRMEQAMGEHTSVLGVGQAKPYYFASVIL